LNDQIKKICVVCIANYCRSPVAERILKKTLSFNFDVSSAGLDPIPKPGMDERSNNFLLNGGYDTRPHTPRRISHQIIQSSDLIFALDPYILMELNKNYRRYSEKIKLLNFLLPKISLNDPYGLGLKEYNHIMLNIEKVCIEISKRV
jgi:protein-tyrosine phosphatase